MLKSYDRAFLEKIIRQMGVIKYYDYVLGVPHPKDKKLTEKQKMDELIKILKQRALIPLIAYNAPPGYCDAIPYWNAPIKKSGTNSSFDTEGVVEIDVTKVK